MKDRKCIAILLSGGVGSRMEADRPKQYIRVKDRLILTYCLETLLAHPQIDAVQIVAEYKWREIILADAERTEGANTCKICGFSIPGQTRQLSILNGMQDILEQTQADDIVLIHDAARPNLTAGQISACIKALGSHDGVLPALPMKDTVYASDNGRTISRLLDRSRLFSGQAPELFEFGKYYEANMRLMPDCLAKVNGSTEPAFMAGMDIVMTAGDENNYKITTPADLERFRRQIEQEKGQSK